MEINNKKLCDSCFAEITEGKCPYCGYSEDEYVHDPTVLPLGTKLHNKIIIGKVMGKGGFGITYLGYDLRMDKTIAVKEYYPNGIAYRSQTGTDVLVADTKSNDTFDNGTEKFYTEAEMVAQFNGNPNIVGVYDYFRENNTVYLIMEYLNGITLKNYVKKHGKISDGQALFVMDKIAAALSITHSAGVLHRDISPDNIMVCLDGKIKLIDFGAARQIMAESSSNLTVVMKPGYTPIEQYTKKGRQGAWTDIYALGASIYYAMTEKIIDDPYERMDNDDEFSENRYGINNTLWSVIKKCTMINAADRYGSAIELRKALSAVSAPIKPEPLKINNEDVKSYGEAEAEEAPAPNASGTAEPIEVFPDEEGTDNTEEQAVQAEGYNPDENVYAKTESKKKPLRKKLLAGIIGGAAAAAIAVTSTVLVVNNLPVQTKYFALDQTDPGDWVGGAEISKDQLKGFKGDIKFTLRLNFVESDKSTNQDYSRDLRIVDASGLPVRVAAPNLSYDTLSEGCYLNSASENNTSMLFEFVLKQEQVEYLDKSIRFEGNNLYVSSATCENYDPSENELSDDAEKLELSVTDFYQDDVMETYSYIPKEALEKFGGDVKIRIYLEESEYMDVNMNDYVVHLYAFDIKGNYVRLYCKNHESRLNNYCIGNYQTMPEYVDMIISEEQISNLSSEGFKFHAKNAHIPYVMLASAGDELEEALLAAEAPESSAPTPTGSDSSESSEAEPQKKILTFELDDSFPGEWQSGKGIDKSALEEFEGDMKVTLQLQYVESEFDAEHNVYHHHLSIVDTAGQKVDVTAFNIGYDSEYSNFYLNGSPESSKTRTFEFVLTQEALDAAHFAIHFQCSNLYVTSATFEDYDPSEYKENENAEKFPLSVTFYQAENYIEENSYIPKSKLESIGGDVKITLHIEQGEYINPDDSIVHFFPYDEYGNSIHLYCKNHDSELDNYCIGNYQCMPDTVTTIISEEQISALGNSGLAFYIMNGGHIPYVTLEAAESSASTDGNADPQKKTLTFELDDSFPGEWQAGKEINKNALEGFKGDIKFKLQLNFVESDKSLMNRNYSRDLRIVDASGQPVRVSAPNLSYDDVSESFYLDSATENKSSMPFEFVLTKEQVKNLDNGICFEGSNLYVSSASCEDYDTSENDLGDDAKKLEINVTNFYQDDVMETDSFIPKDMLEKFGGDVKIRVYLEESDQMVVSMNDYIVRLYAFDIDGNYVRMYCKNHESRLNNYCVGIYKNMPEYVDMIISEEQISNLSSEGFKFHAKNVHIPYVMLASAGNELEA